LRKNRVYRLANFVGLLCAGCASSTPSLSQSATTRLVPASALSLQDESQVAARLLAVHNRERAAAGVPPLRWDPALAAAAAAYGPSLAAAGRLVHSSRTGRPNQSENLWMGTRGAYSPEQMVGSWASERAMFRPGIFPNVSSTGNWLDVAHYTQMIWRSTNAVGCAIYSSRSWDYLICRYSPRGNRDGQRVP